LKSGGSESLNIFENKFVFYQEIRSPLLYWLRAFMSLAFIVGILFLAVWEEYIFRLETFPNVQLLFASGTIQNNLGGNQWDNLDITFQHTSKSNMFIALKSQIEDQQILAFKTAKACTKNSDCNGVNMCLNGFCNKVHWAPSQQAVVSKFELDENFLVWMKPAQYCKNLSQQRVNNIR